MAYLYITDTKGERRECPLPGAGGRFLIGGADDCDVLFPESDVPTGRRACVLVEEGACRICRAYSEQGEASGEPMAEGEVYEWEGLRLMWLAARVSSDSAAEEALGAGDATSPTAAPAPQGAGGRSASPSATPRNVGPLTMANVSSGGFVKKERVSPGYALAALVLILLGLYFGMLARQYQDTGRWSYSLFEEAK